MLQNVKLYILTYIFLSFTTSLLAQSNQANTLVVGMIKNGVATQKDIRLQMNVHYMTSHTDEYTSNVLKDGTFAFGVRVLEPQYATLIYNNQKKLIYLEPNDTLSLEFKGYQFPNYIVYGSKLGADNRFLEKYLKQNPKELSQFKKVQFRKDIFWYSTMPAFDNMMRNTTPEQYNRKLEDKKRNAFSLLNRHREQALHGLTPKFIQFMETEILYDWGYHKLMYGHLYKGRYQLDDRYFDFMDELPISDQAIGNHYYRDYMLAYINYRYGKLESKGDNAYVSQFDMATDILSGSTKAFCQSEMLYKAFLDRDYESMIGRYWNFVDHTEYLDYSEKVNFAYQKAMRYAEGSPAPDFVLQDIEGQEVSLSQYRGRTVYLNFWASWCRPCMKKMEKLRPFVGEMEAAGITFLNISLDKNETNWKNAVNTLNFGGVHAMANGSIDAQIAKKYEVRILPQYYIIDKYGGFAKRPATNDLPTVKSALLELSRK